MFRLDKLNDNELVQRFIQGDHESLEVLIVRHKSRVYSYILLIVKNQDLAEDIFQDTFIKVIRSLKRGKYVENGKFVSWVLRIAHNLIIDHFRKEKLQGTVSNDSSDVDIFNSQKFSEQTIEDQMVYSQILHEVKHLVKELPEDQQQVIYMRHYMGLSFKEIAEQTEVSINTALGRMRYALINLRKLVDEKKLNLSAF
ncbi:RNA polymerase sigma-70 factor, ECF subfamily [Draconibacterium orientale]|jgi:RNA polymerase sigma-70 factor (ECF subfamily)|uniref:RNA polymerase sigma-70 factor, ECF subfamily n=1 Tax=Draconibacterium orientale TaxID=1168034 RepID=X5DHI6_9BACT|nr:sigma-70 family RNA polymerase sigma factor [Draconibacterium orientale]AHW60559.1 RNA polymerase subunit sigma-24 [Draconibacterium orientale]SET02880.1 RNA polymerase sigma-70 factor, ECF subfamily [Draconibacterium orientale]